MVFRYILRGMLHNAAREKVREKVVQAAREQVDAAKGETVQEDVTCDVGVVFALRIEAGGLEDRLTGIGTTTRGHGFVARRGGLHGKRVVEIISGAGRESAVAATEALITGHTPKWIISAGFAGGLDSRLARGDILMVDHLVDTAGNRLAIDLKVDPDSLAATKGVHLGRLLTADRIVRLPEEKRSLGQEHDALAVDMESIAVAGVCQRRGVRFLAVRAINDTVDEKLPRDVDHLLKQKTRTARLGAAAGAIMRRPGSVKDMWQLKENALVASDRLGRFLADMIERL